MIETHPLDRNRRQRRSTTPWDALPALGVVPRAQLLRWLRSDAPTRRWATLQALGGSTRIEAADTLLEMLLAAGCVEVDERFSAGRWWTHQVTWINLSRLQQALGLPSQDERSDQRSRTLQSLEAMAEAVPALRGVARALAIARLSPTALSARSELLAALALWTAEQRTGVRQDFALHARAHTKAVSEAEWR